MLPSLILKNSSVLLYETTTSLNILIAFEGLSKKATITDASSSLVKNLPSPDATWSP